MDELTLAATSFIIALSLMITGRKDKLRIAFIGLCLAVFVSQAAAFLYNYSAADFLIHIKEIGLLTIAPFAFFFLRHLTRNGSWLTDGLIIFAVTASSLGTFFLFTPFGRWPHFHTAVLVYIYAVLSVCYLALARYVNKLAPSVEKKRLRYLLFACPIAVMFCSIDFIKYFGVDFPVITGIVLSSLLYFILLIIAYPQLNELHDFLARALVIYVTTISGAIIFYFVAGFDTASSLPAFTTVLMSSFLIVISVTPIKVILKKIYSYFYPESPNVFTSLYVFDEKLEKEKSMLLAEMAPVFAHEIRNPLGSIKGAAQYLKSEAATEEQQRLLNVIIEEVNRLNAVVLQFLDYARPHTLNLKAQNINILLKRAAATIAANELAKNISIVQNLSPELPLVEVDDQQIMQVILNIAINALEAMPQGGTLTLQSFLIETSAGNAAGIEISDTGQGMSRETEKNIFKPFFTTKERGVGLGLAVCQKIIRDHGGQIRVKSTSGQGTTFFIRLNAIR